MGNQQQGSPYPRLKYSNSNNEAPPPQNLEDFEKRWQVFIQSLDVTPQNIQNIDQLEAPQKIELLLNFEAKNPKCSAFHYVTLIKGLRSYKMTNSKKKDEFQNAKQILSATEISLRTNHVEWVYDFLKHSGLEILVDYMSQILLHLIKSEEMQIFPITMNGSNTISSNYQSTGATISENGIESDFSPQANQSLRRIFDASQRNSTRMSCSKSRSSGINRNTSSVSKHSKSHSAVGDSIKECLHLCLKCFRTILNNQKGCRMAFEYKDTINVITMCLVHPSYQTKSLLLDLLSAVCLIEGGHERVLKAFDLFKVMTREEKRFDTLMYFYRHHETLPLDDYNIDYAVSNMQFINIIVHSVENINLRVYLQYEFTLLGLDSFLKKLQERPGDRLNRQVDAYLDNLVDCSVLLEDAEAKEAFIAECERLEKDISSLQEQLTLLEAEKARKIKEAEDRVRKAEKELEKAQSREDELSLLVESLRSKIRDINVNLSDRESDMKREIADLHDQLKKLNPAAVQNGNIHVKKKPAVPVRQSSNDVKPSSDIDRSKEFLVEMNDSQPALNNDAMETHLGASNIPHSSVSTNKPKLPQTPLKSKEHLVADTQPLTRDEKNATDSLDLVININEKQNKEHKNNLDWYDVSENEELLDLEHIFEPITIEDDDDASIIIIEDDVLESKSSPSMDASITSVTGDAPLIKWNILRNQQGTVFEEIDGSQIEKQLDLDGFEKIFKVPPIEHEYDVPPLDTIDGKGLEIQRERNLNDNQLSGAGANDQSDKISLLDPNRQKCIKMVVTYLIQEKLLQHDSISFREWGRPLACAITNFDMASEAADRLLYQLPSFQETDMYRDITGESLNVLANEDRLVALLSCIDRVEMKLEAILYMDAFDETYFALQEKIRTVALACRSVMESQKLKKILEIVLAFGNRMNDSRRGKAIGFRIQSLDMLPECRSPDDKWSLMNYIAFCIEEKFPDLRNFFTELEYVEDASRVSLCNLMAAFEELSTGLDRVAEELSLIKNAVENNPDLIPTRLVNFVRENTTRVNLLRNQTDQAKIAFVKTVEWFGEKDLQTASPDLFFGALVRFMDSFKKAISENARRQMGDENNRKKNKERKINEPKGDQTRKKNRTRQINADGIMDEIMAGLDYQPLQAGLHARRGKRDNTDSPETSIYQEH